jgi:DNA repair protein RecO (recombination protein O)
VPVAERSLATEAVVLRHKDWGEADRFLVLYTREQGKVRAIVKGARRLRSRKAGHTEPFTRVKLMLNKGRDIWIVTQAETINLYQPVRENLEKMGYAAYVVELVDRFTSEDDPNSYIYTLITNTLKRITESDDPFPIIRFFELHFLEAVGFRPELQFCVHCRREIQPEDQYFSEQEGGVVCPNCSGAVRGKIKISMQTLKYFRHFQRSQYREAMRGKLSPAVRREMEILMERYLDYILEKQLNSPDFIKHLRRVGS